MTEPTTDPFVSVRMYVKMTQTARLFRALFFSSALLMGAGCHSDNQLESKLRASIQFEQVQRPKGTWVMQKISREVLAVLQSSSKKTLQSPKIASAVLGQDKDDSYKLIVFWVAQEPSADSLAFDWGEGGTVTNAVPASYIEENLKESETSVVFWVVYAWEKGTDTWSKCTSLAGRTDLKATLLRAHKLVSAPARVDFVNVRAGPRNQDADR